MVDDERGGFEKFADDCVVVAEDGASFVVLFVGF